MIGIITKTDIVLQLGRCGANACVMSAAELMTTDVTLCRPTDSLPDVLAMMGNRGLVHIPVVDEHFKPVGVVNARDALRVLLAEEQYQEALLRDYVTGVGYR